MVYEFSFEKKYFEIELDSIYEIEIPEDDF